MTVTDAELLPIERRFRYCKPTEAQVHDMKHLRALARAFVRAIAMSCPESRERSLAITKLEESTMWANASIVRQNEPELS